MDEVFFMKKVIAFISDGDAFRRVFSIALKCLAVLLLVAALVAWIGVWTNLSGGAPAAAILGTIIFQMIFVVTVYCVFHTIWMRANHIMELTDSEFVVIRVFSVFARMVGEVWASVLVGIGVAGGILLWFVGPELYYVIQRSLPIPGGGYVPDSEHVFLAGLLIIVVNSILSIFVLGVFYLISELLRVCRDVAINTKGLKTATPPAQPL